MLNKNIIVEQVRGISGLTRIQKSNLVGLGLRRIGSKSELVCTPSVLGMINKVDHLVKVTVN